MAKDHKPFYFFPFHSYQSSGQLPSGVMGVYSFHPVALLSWILSPPAARMRDRMCGEDTLALYSLSLTMTRINSTYISVVRT